MKNKRKLFSIIILTMITCMLMLPYTVLADGGDGSKISGGAGKDSGVSASDEDFDKDEAMSAEGQAYADTGSAINDILNNPRYKGAMSTISAITGFIDTWFVRIITVVAFFIISAALLKNACAGAYCANNKFWDKVDEAHKHNEALSLAKVKDFFGNKGFMNTPIGEGGVKTFLLGIIPNVKAFTDFEDQDIAPKTYFMRAIPQMIACVIIGVFIYNGYYRDVSATVGEMGSVIVSKTLLSVDPEGMVNVVFNTTSWPPSPFKNDPSREGKAMDKVHSSVKNAISTKFTDVTSNTEKNSITNTLAAKIKVAFALEQAGESDTAVSAHSLFDPDSELVEDGMMYSCNSVNTVLSTEPGISMGEGVESNGVRLYNLYADGSANYTFVYEIDLMGIVNTAQMDSSGRYALVTMSLKKSVDDGSPGISNANIGQVQKSNNYKKIVLAVPKTAKQVDVKYECEKLGYNMVNITKSTRGTLSNGKIAFTTGNELVSEEPVLIAVGSAYKDNESYSIYIYAKQQ